MQVDSEFVGFVLERMAPIGEVRARAMFGGFGIFQRDIIFAIVVDDRLYFKADGTTRRRFSELGLAPFTYAARGKTIVMQYYEAPPEVFESAAAMSVWARRSIAAALRTRAGKPGGRCAAR